MTTSMPISVLENILREVNKDTELERLAKEEAEKQAEKNKEKVEKLKEILDIERGTEEEKSISTEQSLEKPKTQDSRKTTRNGPDNKQKVAKRSKSSS